MSVPVALPELAAQISRFGSTALLVTTATDRPPHVSSVIVTFEGDNLAMSVGRQTRSNATKHPAVTLVWTGGIESKHCLIVDAVAREDVTETLLVTPTSAVLHRIAGAPTDTISPT